MRAQKLPLGTHIHATHFQSVVIYNTINSMYVCILLFLQRIVQWCTMLCIISTSTIKRIARMDSHQAPTYHFGITWAVSQDHCCSSVITIRKLNRKLYIGDYRLTRQLYSEAIGYINRIETIGD